MIVIASTNTELDFHADVKYILETWFSTTFFVGTHQAVVAAIKNINASCVDRDVAIIIGHWKSINVKIPLSTARERWLEILKATTHMFQN